MAFQRYYEGIHNIKKRKYIMTRIKQLMSSGKPFGKIILHLHCINQDKKIRWHLRGIIHELKTICLGIFGKKQSNPLYYN